MAIRVTQQAVDVLGAGEGFLRVSRQYVEVLHGAASTNYNESANHAISFVSTAVGAHDVLVSASSTLAFVSGVLKSVTESVSDTLGIVDSVFVFNAVEDRQVPENTLVFTQFADTSEFKTVTQNLALTQNVIVQGPILVATSAKLTFTHLARNINIYRIVTDTFAVTDMARVPIELTINETLTLVDLTSMTNVAHVITFVQTAVGGRSPGVQIQPIVLVDTAVNSGTFRRTVTDTLGIGHSLTYFEDSPCNRKNYTPFRGDTTVPSAKTAPAAEAITPQADTSVSDPCAPSRFLLYWPARGARDTTVSIRAPEFGNRDRNAYTRVSRETRGGRLVVYSDTAWPNVRSMAVTFIGLTKAHVTSLQSLFYDHLGEVIGITDWEGFEWEGIITDPGQPATEDGGRGWTVTFNFEGVIIDGYSPGHDLGITDVGAWTMDPGANSDLALVQVLGGSEPRPTPSRDLSLIQAASAVVV